MNKDTTLSLLSKLKIRTIYAAKYLVYIAKLVFWRLRTRTPTYPLITRFKKGASYIGAYAVYGVKFVLWKIRRFVRTYPRYTALAAGVLTLIIAGVTAAPYINQYIHRVKPLPLTTAPANSPYQYMASDKKTSFNAYIGEKKSNNPKVRATFGSLVSVDFVLTKLNPTITKPTQSDNKVTFTNVRNNVDLSYQTLTDGIKEDIVVKQPMEGNAFTFDLNIKGATPKKIAPQTYGSIFYDAQKQAVFHFEKPFAVDATGARTDNVILAVHKKDADIAYQTTIVVNEKWLNDPKRVYPVTIDPTLVWSASTDFSNGSFNRVKDIGGVTSTPVSVATGGTITYSGGYTIHTFTGNGTFTPNSSMNVEYLVVGGGGGGGYYYGSGGGGGGFQTGTLTVTAQAYLSYCRRRRIRVSRFYVRRV